MSGFDDHVASMGDWMLPSPSTRAFFSSMINDGVAASSIADFGQSEPLFAGPEKQGSSVNPEQNNHGRASVEGDETSNSNTMAEPKTSSRGGLMERIAARAGFNAPRLNTESIRPTDLSKNQEIRSPYFTIPPGVSPTTLLDSPVFLTNSLVQPSPTTGKLSFLTCGNDRDSNLTTDGPEKGKENTFNDVNASSFAFKPVADSVSFPYFNAPNKISLSYVHSILLLLPIDEVNPSAFAPQSFHSDKSVVHQQANFSTHVENNGGSNHLLDQTYNSVDASEHSPPLDEPNDDGDPNNGGGPAEDGYNWRKYGQKQVKGSEYPRSYYKCTDSNCSVKKKVERSHEGHITEIIYKGAHNHPKPPPNRRSALGSSNAFGDMQLESEQPRTGSNGDFIWLGMQKGKLDNPEATSSALLGPQYSNGATTLLQAQSVAEYESQNGVDGSPTFSNEENEDDDGATHGSVSLGYDGEGDESELKRRRIEAYAPEMSGPSRAIREPRVVVQTTSEVDILDDGYRWRKYGQKVVKGNPNPRSYYKCTSPGCNVRKHVERASHDLKSVITTYEGKHNHDVPAARNTGHGNSGGPNTLPTQQTTTAAASSHTHRPEPSQIHGSGARFERPSLGSFGFPGLGPGPGFGFGMNQHGLTSMGLAGLGPNQGKLPVFPVHPYLGHQSRPVNDMSFMLPKGELKFEPVTDSGLSSSNSSSVYQQLMNRLPLGPHM
ncbi:hypothetical protein BUALT_Bualt03G0162300 [Buddleja alternifolia]|uniref:WRKY domain-containing protein n=1 Tax=Buddleja alternifolia TaxID=168488 RepID=A0AAV6Y2C1_9LAMI|nr:hypothetical protein BUALT_Bualt03G0162300 [Buddleja alternifolia]